MCACVVAQIWRPTFCGQLVCVCSLTGEFICCICIYMLRSAVVFLIAVFLMSNVLPVFSRKAPASMAHVNKPAYRSGSPQYVTRHEHEHKKTHRVYTVHILLAKQFTAAPTHTQVGIKYVRFWRPHYGNANRINANPRVDRLSARVLWPEKTRFRGTLAPMMMLEEHSSIVWRVVGKIHMHTEHVRMHCAFVCLSAG